MDSDWSNEQVNISDIPQLEQVSFQSHPIRFRKMRLISMVLFWSIPFLVIVIISFFTGSYWYVAPLGALVVLILLSILSIYKGFKKRSYALRERDVTYKKGWLFYSITTIPFNRIQHTEVSQGPLERRFQLSTLKIYTAGGSTSDLSIPGLEEAEAQELRDYIANKVVIYA